MGAARVIGPGGAVAAACLALLSLWRFADGQLFWAVVLLALALGQLALAFRRGRGGERPAGRPPAGAPADVRRGWVRIAVLGLVLSAAAVFWFPPLALVLAGTALYSVHRARRASDPGHSQGG